MKPAPTHNEILSFMDRLKATIKLHTARSADIEAANTAKAGFTATLAKLGLPHYADDDAIRKVSITQLKLSSCEEVLKKLTAELFDVTNVEVRRLVNEGGRLSGLVLEPVYEQILTDTAAVFRPFNSSLERARDIAEATDAVAGAREKFMQYGYLHSIFGLHDPTPKQAKEALAKIEAVLSEALKEKSNLQQFLSFDPHLDERPAVAAKS